MDGLGFSKDMGLMRYILKLWKLLRGTSGEFGRIVGTHVQYRNVWAAYGGLWLVAEQRRPKNGVPLRSAVPLFMTSATDCRRS